MFTGFDQQSIAALVGDGSPGPVGLAFIGIVLVAVFARLSRAAAEGNETARLGAIVQVVALSAAGGLALLAAVFLVGLKCDETCQIDGHWWDTETPGSGGASSWLPASG